MDRKLATKEVPLLNRGEPYVPDAGRTYEDDEAIIYDANREFKKRTHLSDGEFERIYMDVMNFFTITERLQYRMYQTGQKPKEEFLTQLRMYLQQAWGARLASQTDMEVMVERVMIAVFGYDVLQPLIDNPETSDIKVCGPYDIRVRVKGKAYKSNAVFMNDSDLNRFVDGLALKNNVDIYRYPVLTFTDKHDAHYILRFTVSSPTVNAVDFPYLHIRKVPVDKPDFDDLIKAKMMNEDIKLYLIDRAKAARGIFFAGPPGCVDKDTEFFNGKEWKSVADYVEGEKVLQFDTNTKEATLIIPEKYIKEPCDFMYHFETEYGIDQTLSPEHRVLYLNQKRKNGKKYWDNVFHEISAKELSEKLNRGDFYGGFKTDFFYNGTGINLTDEEIKQKFIVTCDGEFDNIFTKDWYQCSHHQLEIVCKTILQWTKKNHKNISTTVKAIADFIQFAYSACGYRATIQSEERKGQICYEVIVCENTIVEMTCHKDEKTNNVKLEEFVPVDGYKYCFTVPTHALVLRRNNKIFITGNSGKSTALNAFIEFIPKTRETLVIQENDELTTRQSGFMFKHVTHGFQGEPICTLEDLGRMALVEGCNEFVIGEVKGGEMRNAMTLCNAGGYFASTIHANNAYEVLDKAADLVKYGSTYTFNEARRMLKSIDTIVYMEGFKVREILECTGYNDETNQFEYVNIYRYEGDKEKNNE